MKTYRVAVVGIGYIGVEHVKAISENPRTTLRVMVGTDASWERLETLKAEYVAEYISTDYRAVLQDEKVDVVYLCTPNRLHADQTVAALEAGKHVFCEKPMATKLEDCRRMVAAVDRTGCQLMVGHGARFQPLQQAIKALHQEGKLGQACFCEADYVHSLQPFLAGTTHQWWRHAEEGQFAVIGGGCHPLDLMRWIVGELEEVSAYGTRKVLQQVEWQDTVIAMLKFSHGVVGKCLVSVGAPRPYAMNFSLYGTEGTVENNKLFLKAFGQVEAFSEMPHSLLTEGHACVVELEHFVQCLDQGQLPLIDVREGAKTVAACLAIAESLASGQAVKVITDF